MLVLLCASSIFFVHPEASSATFKLGKPPYTYILASNLVAHWTFDGSDTVAGTFRDKTANANHARPINISTTTFYTAGKIGQAIRLDGANDYVNIGQLSATQSASALTWSFWVNINRLRANDVFLSKGNIFSSAAWQIAMTNGCTTGWQIIVYIPVAVDDGGTLGCAPSVGGMSTNEWVHYVVVFDGAGVGNAARLQIYANGSPQTVDFIGTIPATTNAATDIATIGSQASFTLNINSVVDDVRIYSRALPVSEIAQLYRFGVSKHNSTSRTLIATGLQGHWTFDGPEMAGGVARDRSANGFNATTSNIATSTFYTPGRIGQAVKLDGTNDFLGTALSITYPVSGCAWIFPTAQPFANPEIIGSSPFSLRLIKNDETNYALRIFNSNSAVTTADNTITLDTWQHVCGTVSAANDAVAYINGVALASGNIGAAVATTITKIGMNPNGTSNPYTGKIDDVRIYNRVLTDQEVAELYSSGR
ncbi:MAG: LamG domain-containing protein [Patescibacteria group bacterium]